MSKFKIIAGDVPSFDLNNFPIKSADLVTEENKKSFVGAAGWGLVGDMAFGPLGMLAGVLLGGNKKEVCVAVEFYDGRRCMVITDPSGYQKLKARTM
jgi:hypothetical protein